MSNYTALISFKIDIKAENQEQAEYIASKAIPTHFGFIDGKGGSGEYLRGLPPVVYEQEVEDNSKPDSYWRNR